MQRSTSFHVKSLLTMIKVLQMNDDLNQPANKNNHNDNRWKKVNGRVVSEKRGEALSFNKNDTVINSQFEVLSASNIEIKSQETSFDKRRPKAMNINKRLRQSNKDKYERQSNDSARPSEAEACFKRRILHASNSIHIRFDRNS